MTVLFNRFSPEGRLFPPESVLLKTLSKLNASEIVPLWAEDETIGWIYQYYNDEAERKKMREESSAPRNSRELAVRNQFFTPRYVVEFLTDNTLGRIWYEMTQGQTSLKGTCRYMVRRPDEVFLSESAHTPVGWAFLPVVPSSSSSSFSSKSTLSIPSHDAAPAAIKKSKESDGQECPSYIEQSQIPKLIIEHNIHGIDIDPRAAQIAGLSLWLQAQRAWFHAGVKPADRPRITRSNVVCAEPMPGEKELLREFVEQQFVASERPAFAFLLQKGIRPHDPRRRGRLPPSH